MNGFAGKGLRLPLTLEGGRFVRVDGSQLIVQSIWTILNTCRGEREMRPDLGSGLYDLVFGNDDPATLGRLARDVQESLKRWEPRIDVLGVRATVDPLDPDRVLVRIEYSERNSGDRHNLVYPFHFQ